MKYLLLFLLFPFLVFSFEPVQNSEGYQVEIDLVRIKDGRVKVEMIVPILEQDTVVYNMPKIVPGTYKIYNFGRFIHDFQAFNSRQESLKVEQINTNQWKIENAKELYRIVYWVSDTYHDSRSKIFAPAGTSISEDAFLMNNYGFFGYLEGFKDFPFELNVVKRQSHYGVTSLNSSIRTDSLDVFTASNYFNLHDSPILYAQPDTASLTIAGVPIMVAVYSPEGHIGAKKVRDAVTPVFNAAAEYLGGVLPAEQYNVLIYGQTLKQSLSGSGALEHHTSTVVNMPDVAVNILKMFSEGDPMQMYRDIVAHEFFHIVTPLNIHSQEISDFDFINPTMSEHLWLYEGVTEYNSMIAQARADVFSLEEFINQVRMKINGAKSYNPNVPFTQLSKYALSFHSNQYYNVYDQGALIGLATDLKLRSLSDGEFGLIDLLQKMWTTYGADTFFVDHKLFGIMAQNSYPEMEEFFVRHVAGTEPLPLEDLFEEVGITYNRKIEQEIISTGGIRLIYHPKRKEYVVMKLDDQSLFAQNLGIKLYDVVKAWNGVELSTQTDVGKVLTDFQNTAKEGEDIKVIIERKEEEKTKTIKLKTRVVKEKKVDFDVITINESLTDKQRTLRDFWIKN